MKNGFSFAAFAFFARHFFWLQLTLALQGRKLEQIYEPIA